jgi:hypothetical protein
MLRDWHEHDGYIWSRQSTTWQSVEQLLTSDQALYDGRAGDTFVRLAYYPSDSSFLLRIYVMDEDEEPEYPGRWGNFDLSGAPSLLTTISSQLPETVQPLLRREQSGAYFRLYLCGVRRTPTAAPGPTTCSSRPAALRLL